MNYIGGIEGMNFNPITNYNNYIKNTKSFDMDANMDFENVLDKQTAALQDPMKIQGGVEVSNFDNILAQTAVEPAEDSSSTASFVKSFSNSINGGLNSTNNAVQAANRAQEAFAMGENVSVHDVMIASEKASLSMQMTMQLRNKLMNAYAELNNVKV